LRRPNASVGMWTALAIGIPLCLIIARGAYSLADYSWSQVVDFKSPYVSQRVPAELASTEPTPAPALARRVVLIIVDGLREDVSRSSMPALNALRAKGGDFTLTVPQPSLSFPNWTTILTGASPSISGVTTNWHTGRVLAPTLVDVARAAGRKVVVVGPEEFADLYGIKQGKGAMLRKWEGQYLSTTLIDDALQLSKETTPALILIHLPDLDEAGHESGGASADYKKMAAQVDSEISRLSLGLEETGTAFVVTADHGHTDSGGHGGWEKPVLRVPGVFSGKGCGLAVGKGEGELTQMAPTIAALLGIRPPAFAEGQVLRPVFATAVQESAGRSDTAHHAAFDAHYTGVTRGVWVPKEQVVAGPGADATAAAAREARLSNERAKRMPIFIVVCVAVAAMIAVIGRASWRALVAALAGALAYYAMYDLLFFLIHGYRWSLSAFNTETYVKTFMNWRLVEAGFAALFAVAVAAYVYPLLRREPQGPQVSRYLAGYLALGPATVLVILGTLGLQVAWFLWVWGADVVWTLPDLREGFKYDLDLVQMTGVGGAVLIAPLVAYVMGRYHPKVM
jgi:hypothetical protein